MGVVVIVLTRPRPRPRPHLRHCHRHHHLHLHRHRHRHSLSSSSDWLWSNWRWTGMRTGKLASIAHFARCFHNQGALIPNSGNVAASPSVLCGYVAGIGQFWNTCSKSSVTTNNNPTSPILQFGGNGSVVCPSPTIYLDPFVTNFFHVPV